jgi:hypothetical protein
MPNTYHDQLTGDDLHDNKVYPATGTPLPSWSQTDARYPRQTRTITTTAPLTGGGNLSTDRTLSLPAATASVDGYLSHTDWATFNAKQAALGFTPVNKAGDTLAGVLVGATQDKGGQVYNVLAYGAKADAQTGTGASITVGTSTLTVASAAFTAADVGKGITIVGAGNAGADRRTTIAAYLSPTQVTLGGNAQTTVSNADFYFGTLTHGPLQAAMDAASAAGGGIVYLPPGRYFFNIARVNLRSFVEVRGAGCGVTTLLGGTAGDCLFANSAPTLTGAVLRDLTIDLKQLTNGTGAQLYYANNCVIERIEIKNGAAGGWLLKFGVANSGTDTFLCTDNKIIDCVFDGHANSLEMLLLFNCKNTEVIRPKFRNKTVSGPGLGLWQKCYNTRIIDAQFTDILGREAIYYSYTCDDTTITRPYFENTGGGIAGANSSDYGDFGASAVYNLTIDHLVYKGGPNSLYATAIELGSVNGATVISPYIEGAQIGILLRGRGTPNTPTVNFSIVNPIIKNCNPENAIWGLHPGIMFGLPASSYGSVIGGQIFDDQASKTMRYPIIFSGTGTWDKILISGVRLAADTANGGVSVYKNNAGGILGSDVVIRDCTDYSGNNPSQTPLLNPLATKTSAYTLTATDSVILADATSAAFQVTLPSAVGIAGRQYTIKRTNSGSNNVTVGTTSSQLIEGANTKTLGSQWAFLTVTSDGTGWVITAQGGTVS